MRNYNMDKKFVDGLVVHCMEDGKLNPYLLAHYVMRSCIEVIDDLPLLDYSGDGDEWDSGYRDCAKDSVDGIYATFSEKADD